MPFSAPVLKEDNSSAPLVRVFRSRVGADTEVFSEHHHTACEITMVLSGCGIYATKNAEFDFAAGDVFFFSTDEYHFIKKLGENADFLNIHFEPRYIWSDNFGISNAELIKTFFNRKDLVNKLESSSESARLIRELIYKINDEMAKKRPEYTTMVKIHLLNILVEMLRSLGFELSTEEKSGNSQTMRAVEDAMNYINANLESDLTLEGLSDYAHMSKTYFCSQFKKLNGISPWEYITIKRIEKAIMLIESTSLTKLEIAARCGYNNTSNFYHAFRRITGKTPRDYKP